MSQRSIATIVSVAIFAIALGPVAHAERKRSSSRRAAVSTIDPIEQAFAESKQAQEREKEHVRLASATAPAAPESSAFPTAGSGEVSPVSSSAPVTTERKPMKKLIIGGSILLGSTWLLTTAVSVGVFGRTNTWPSAIPLLGPWIQMGYIGFEDETIKLQLRTALAISGLWQLAGLALIVGGSIGRPEPSTPVAVRVVPMLAPGTTGLVMAGSF